MPGRWILIVAVLCTPGLARADEKRAPTPQQRLRQFVRTVDAGNVYELVQALDNPVYRDDAMATLTKIGAPAVQPLLERYDDPKTVNRVALVTTLGRLGPAASSAWPKLMEWTKEKDRELAVEVSRALTNNAADVVPTLVAALRGSDTTLRVNAARLLAELGPQAEAAVPALREALQDRRKTALLRFWCVAALAEIGPAAHPALPELLVAFREMEGKERYLPAKALGRIGPPARVAVPELIEMVKNRKSIHNAETAAQALAGIGVDAVPALVDLLRGESRERKLQEVAAQTLAVIGAPAVPYLLRALSDRDQGLVDRAAFVLVQIGEPAVAELLALMNSTPDRSLQFVVAQIIARIPAASPMAVPGLLAGLQNPNALERVAAARALAAVGPPAAPAIPALLEALKADLDVAAARYGAAFPQTYVSEMGGALVSIGEEAILPLHRALLDTNPVVQSVAVQALANLGQVYQREIVARMISSLMKPHPQLNERAVQVLSSIQPTAFALARLGPKAVPGLGEALRHGSHGLRVSSAHALAMLGDASVMTLVECLVEPDLTVRLTAVQALGAMRGRATPAIPALIKELKSIEQQTQEAPNIKPQVWQEYAVSIALALGNMGEPAVVKLAELLADKDPQVRAAGAMALAQIGPAAASAVESLREVVKGDDLDVRGAAIFALDRIGPAALSAAPDLVALLRDSGSLYRDQSDPEMLRGRYRISLADALARMGIDVVPTLIPLLTDQDETVRTHAGYAIYKVRLQREAKLEVAAEYEPVLTAALADSALVVRIAAAKVLFHQEPPLPTAVGPLIEAVRTTDAVLTDVRFEKKLPGQYLAYLVRALDHIGEPSVEPLVAAAREDHPHLRGVAAWALARIAPDASQLIRLGEESIPLLVSAVAQYDSVFGQHAAETLIELGNVSVRPLLEAQASNDPAQVDGARRTLARMHETSALTIIEGLEDPNPAIRSAAARALGGPRPAGPNSIPVSDSLAALEKALKDEDANVRNSAAHSLRFLDMRLAEQLGVGKARPLREVLDEINGIAAIPDLSELPKPDAKPPARKP